MLEDKNEIIMKTKKTKQKARQLPLLTDEEIEEAARVYAIDHSSAPDKDCPVWIIADFKAGAKFARQRLINK